MNVKKSMLFLGLITATTFSFAQEISLMSYNIGSANWNTTKDSVIGIITANDPDVFCAIEAGQSSRPYLESALTNYRMLQTFGSTPQSTDSHIFLKINLFSVLDSGKLKVATYGGYTGPDRYINWARVKVVATNKEFVVYASHFVATVGAKRDSAILGQYRHADAMMNLMNQHVSWNIPQITVGDFNASEQKDVMKFILNQTSITFNGNTITNPIVLDDSWVVANSTAVKPSSTFSGFSTIDWIIVTPNTYVTSAFVDASGTNSSSQPPSDHKALQISFDLTLNTSLIENPIINKVVAYPNPFNNYINFDLKDLNSNYVEVTIFDINGRLILTENVNPKDYTFKLDISFLNKGIYFYQIKAEEDVISGKLVKSN